MGPRSEVHRLTHLDAAHSVPCQHEGMMGDSHAVNSSACANTHDTDTDKLSLLTVTLFYFSFCAPMSLNWLLLNVTRIQNHQSCDANMHFVFKDSHVLYYKVGTVKWWIMDSRSYFGHFFKKKKKTNKPRTPKCSLSL